MKAVIIEDENLIARELKEKIMAVAADVEVIEVLPSLKTANRWFLENAEPDILFMDIQLSDGISFQLFERYEIKCPVVFTTAYDEYAVKAFKVNGVDYLLKPVNEEELHRAIAKCRAVVASKATYPLPMMEQLLQTLLNRDTVSAQYKEKFIVNVRHQWLPINTENIACFSRENLNYIFTFSGEKYILDFTTLEEVEELLNPVRFFRANRQTIINVDAIQGVRLHENQKLTVQLKAPLKLEVDISR